MKVRWKRYRAEDPHEGKILEFQAICGKTDRCRNCSLKTRKRRDAVLWILAIRRQQLARREAAAAANRKKKTRKKHKRNTNNEEKFIQKGHLI